MPNYNQYPNDGYQPPDYLPPAGTPEFHDYPGFNPEPPKKKHTGLYLIGGALLALIIVFMCAALAFRNTDPSGEPAKPTVSAAPKTTAAKAAKTKAPAVAKPVTPQVGNGTFIGGTDMKPGKYRTAGAREGIVQLCSWYTAPDDTIDNIIEQGVVNEVDAPGYVTVKTGQYFTSHGCKPWVKQ